VDSEDSVDSEECKDPQVGQQKLKVVQDSEEDSEDTKVD